MHAGSSESAPPLKRPITAAAILSASLLGLALAWCACTLMPLVAGHHAAGAALSDNGSPEGICASDGDLVADERSERLTR